MTAPPWERARPGERDRRVRKGGDAVRQAVVDDGCRERGRIVHGSGRPDAHRPARQLCGDHRPSGVGVATREIEAPEAGAEARLHKGADPGAGVIEDDGEVRHIAAEPRQVASGRDHPGRDDHRERHPVDRCICGDLRFIAEHGEVRRELLADGVVGIERHERACTVRIDR